MDNIDVPSNTNNKNDVSATSNSYYSTYNSSFYPINSYYNNSEVSASEEQSYEACEVRGCWRKLYDYQSGYWYYQNLWTNTTQWEPPDGWESWPISGQPGQTTDDSSAAPEEKSPAAQFRQSNEDIVKKNSEYIKRPAKRQIDPEEAKKIHWRPEGANEYNIWYDKYIGEHWKSMRNEGPAETRCCIKKDAGYTKATLHDPSGKKNYFCIYFARGCCHLGLECGYLHLVPADKDEKRIDFVHDVFGREKHKLHSENMGGVGSFEKDCRTLYVGRLGNNYDIESDLWSEFSEWGEIEDIRVIKKRQIAFVRYKNRVNAEFAKVAMSDQRLEGQGVLNVRWAYDDPNPRAQKQKTLDDRDALRTAVYAKLEDEPQPKRLCSEGIIGSYPDTDDQYPDSSAIGPQTKEQIEQQKIVEQAQQDWNRLDQVFRTLESNR